MLWVLQVGYPASQYQSILGQFHLFYHEHVESQMHPCRSVLIHFYSHEKNFAMGPQV